jgi:nucleoside-diphosphate-sugar epimerase
MGSGVGGALPLTGRRILVTGASGFLGAHLVARLIAEGARVGALARGRGCLDEFELMRPFTFLPCDLTDAAATREAFEGFAPEIVFHFASHPDACEQHEHMQTVLEVNAGGTLNTLEALRLCGGRAILYGDSCKVYGSQAAVPYREATPVDPGSSYALSKLAGWHLCLLYSRLHGIAAVALRPTLIYGPRQGLNLITFAVDRLLAGHAEIPLDGGVQTRDPLFVADALDAFVAAAERAHLLDGRVINLGGGHELTVEALVGLVVELSGRRSRVVSYPERARPTEIWRSFCDNAEAEQLLGWRPRTPLRSGLVQTIEHLLADRAKGAAVR